MRTLSICLIALCEKGGNEKRKDHFPTVVRGLCLTLKAIDIGLSAFSTQFPFSTVLD